MIKVAAGMLFHVSLASFETQSRCQALWCRDERKKITKLENFSADRDAAIDFKFFSNGANFASVKV